MDAKYWGPYHPRQSDNYALVIKGRQLVPDKRSDIKVFHYHFPFYTGLLRY